MKPKLDLNVSHNYLQAQMITINLIILLMSKYGHVFMKAHTKAGSSGSPVVESAQRANFFSLLGQEREIQKEQAKCNTIFI